MTRSSPLGVGFLELEDSDPHIGLAIGVAAIIAGPAPSQDEARIWLDRGLESHGRLRQRIRRTPWT